MSFLDDDAEEVFFLDYSGTDWEGHVGPFASKEAADAYARMLNSRSGGAPASWSVVPLTLPEDLL